MVRVMGYEGEERNCVLVGDNRGTGLAVVWERFEGRVNITCKSRDG